MQKQLLERQNMKEDHEYLVKLQEENNLMKRKIINIKNKKTDTPEGNTEEKTLQEELSKCNKAIESDNNRTKFYIKRFENSMKSIMEAIEKTKQEVERKEQMNKEVEDKIETQKKIIKENKQKLKQEAISNHNAQDISAPANIESAKQSTENFYGAEDPGDAMKLGSDDVSYFVHTKI